MTLHIAILASICAMGLMVPLFAKKSTEDAKQPVKIRSNQNSI